MDRGAWGATAHGVAESDMTEQLTQTFFRSTKGLKKFFYPNFFFKVIFLLIYNVCTEEYTNLKCTASCIENQETLKVNGPI